jgi:hypothetical protein
VAADEFDDTNIQQDYKGPGTDDKSQSQPTANNPADRAIITDSDGKRNNKFSVSGDEAELRNYLLTKKVLHSISGRIKRNSGSTQGRAVTAKAALNTQSSFEISIADFLNVVNCTHQGILSNAVLDHFVEKRASVFHGHTPQKSSNVANTALSNPKHNRLGRKKQQQVFRVRGRGVRWRRRRINLYIFVHVF